jgi:hypothetical protein
MRGIDEMRETKPNPPRQKVEPYIGGDWSSMTPSQRAAALRGAERALQATTRSGAGAVLNKLVNLSAHEARQTGKH